MLIEKTMERLTAIVCDLRTVHRFNGYIHLKTIPGASPELLQEAVLIVNSRRFNRITSYHLKKMGVVMKKTKYFITCSELTSSFSQLIIGINEMRPERLRPLLLSKAQQKRTAAEQQLTLDFQDDNS